MSDGPLRPEQAPPHPPATPPPPEPPQGPEGEGDILDRLIRCCGRVAEDLLGMPEATFGDDWYTTGIVGQLLSLHLDASHRLHCLPLELPPGTVTAGRAAIVTRAVLRWAERRRAFPPGPFERMTYRVRHERLILNGGRGFGPNGFHWQHGVDRLWEVCRIEFANLAPPPRPRCANYEEASDAVDSLLRWLEETARRQGAEVGPPPGQELLDWSGVEGAARRQAVPPAPAGGLRASIAAADAPALLRLIAEARGRVAAGPMEGRPGTLAGTDDAGTFAFLNGECDLSPDLERMFFRAHQLGVDLAAPPTLPAGRIALFGWLREAETAFRRAVAPAPSGPADASSPPAISPPPSPGPRMQALPHERPSPFTIPSPQVFFAEGPPSQPPPPCSMTVGQLIDNLTNFAVFYEQATAEIAAAEPVMQRWYFGYRDANAHSLHRQFLATNGIGLVRAYLFARHGEELTITSARRLLGDIIGCCGLTFEAAQSLLLEDAMARLSPDNGVEGASRLRADAAGPGPVEGPKNARGLVQSGTDESQRHGSSRRPGKGQKRHPNEPSDDRKQEILAAIMQAKRPLTRPELVEALKLSGEGKLGHNLAWMAGEGKILVNIKDHGYWPANLPTPK